MPSRPHALTFRGPAPCAVLYHLFAQKAGLDREGLGMLYATLLGDALSEEEIAAVVEGAARRIDADGDGEVSCNEFAQVIDEEVGRCNKRPSRRC